MKRAVACLLLAILLPACATSTMIKSQPDDAKVYIDGQYIGNTPCKYSDAGVCWTKNDVVLKKEGYQEVHGQLSKSETKVFNIVMAVLILVPALWATGYPDEFNYELEPVKQ